MVLLDRKGTYLAGELVQKTAIENEVCAATSFEALTLEPRLTVNAPVVLPKLHQ